MTPRANLWLSRKPRRHSVTLSTLKHPESLLTPAPADPEQGQGGPISVSPASDTRRLQIRGGQILFWGRMGPFDPLAPPPLHQCPVFLISQLRKGYSSGLRTSMRRILGLARFVFLLGLRVADAPRSSHSSIRSSAEMRAVFSVFSSSTGIDSID